jgi:hypothetical protein
MKKTYFFYFIFLVITSYLLLAIAYYFGYSSLISDSIFPGFNDLRVVAESCDCYRMGYNPHIVKNEYCKWIFNYPLIWLDILKFLGLSGKNIYLTGFIMLGAFLISSLKLFNNLTIKQMIGLFFIMLSPPILLLTERANIDIFIFVITTFAIFYIRKIKDNTITLHITYLIIVFSAILKLFPIFFLVLVIIEKQTLKTKLFILSYSILIFLSYFYFHVEELNYILHSTPKPSELAFGKNVLIQEFIPPHILPIVSLIPFVIALTWIYIKRKWFFALFEFFDTNLLNFKLFFSGSSLFLGAYLFGNNWDYRLVFVLFLFPFVFQLTNLNSISKKFKQVFYVSCVIVLLTTFIHRSGYFFNNYIQWFIGRNLFMSLKYISLTVYAAFSMFLILFYLDKFVLNSRFRDKLNK